MKRGVLVWMVRTLVVALLVTTVSGCDEAGAGGGTGAGELTYGGDTTTLDQLYFLDYGDSGNGVYNIDVYLMPSTLNWSDGSGTGRYVYLEMFFSSPQVAAGTYTFSDELDPPAGTFSDYSDVSTVTDTGDDWEDFTSGEVTISISGSTYTIRGSGSTDLGSLSFEYSGPLTGSEQGDF